MLQIGIVINEIYFRNHIVMGKTKKQVLIDQIQRKFSVRHICAGIILKQQKVTGIVK